METENERYSREKKLILRNTSKITKFLWHIYSYVDNLPWTLLLKEVYFALEAALSFGDIPPFALQATPESDFDVII